MVSFVEKIVVQHVGLVVELYMKNERGAVLGSGRGAVRGTRGGSGSGTRSSIRRNETYLKIIPTHHNYRNGMVIRDQIKDKTEKKNSFLNFELPYLHCYSSV